MRNNIIFSCSILILLFCACKKGNGDHKHHKAHDHHKKHDHNDANTHMNKSSLEELESRFESAERLITQKPYEVIALFGDLKGKKIMDIGAGTGYFTFKLAEKGAEVIAGDVSDEFQEYIRHKMKTLKIPNTQLKLRKLHYDDPLLYEEEVDGAIVVNTYHHIDQRVPYFSKVRNGLRPQGLLMIVDFMKKEFENEVPGPPIEMRISSDEVIQELRESGFTNIELDETLLPFQYIVKAYK